MLSVQGAEVRSCQWSQVVAREVGGALCKTLTLWREGILKPVREAAACAALYTLCFGEQQCRPAGTCSSNEDKQAFPGV